ncbi:MAG: hypothetical protein ACYSSP_03520 [Planctomycetota bacterium]|jgi:hypothetical protein
MEKEDRHQIKSGKKSIYKILDELGKLMRDFRKRFLKVAVIEAEGYLTEGLLSSEDIDDEERAEYITTKGRFFLVNHTSKCGLTFYMQFERVSWSIDYYFEDLIFQTWSYSTGESLSGGISEAFFVIDDPGQLCYIDDIATEIETVMFPLTINEKHKKLASRQMMLSSVLTIMMQKNMNYGK